MNYFISENNTERRKTNTPAKIKRSEALDFLNLVRKNSKNSSVEVNAEILLLINVQVPAWKISLPSISKRKQCAMQVRAQLFNN